MVWKSQAAGQARTLPDPVIERMMSLLDALAASPDPASLKQLAAATELHPSTAHRILAAMTAARFVERQDSGTYRLASACSNWQHRQIPHQSARSRPALHAGTARAHRRGPSTSAPATTTKSSHLERTSPAGAACVVYLCRRPRAAAPDLPAVVPRRRRPAENPGLRQAYRPSRQDAAADQSFGGLKRNSTRFAATASPTTTKRPNWA